MVIKPFNAPVAGPTMLTVLFYLQNESPIMDSDTGKKIHCEVASTSLI